ncbi:helix-turn-helix domain-containing protein [Streptomyces europaeiscabiei]|uniref:helix-turn-helix domain-containing protein n=1 Tax=Streptomyces europaeiscabiei TaxID=146819 RepID=UPI0029B5E81F|nr:helix-turn-helix transcriptional regulator [Streptomyces europaeiscabiei]MDX3839064.1 helix-turn-helix transcriptional regulator [Streptomyces europaeiscabiei]
MSGRELWADGRLRAAWAARDWPKLIRRYRALAGISQTRMGELVGMDQGYVSRLERGQARVTSEAVVTRFVRGLGVPVELGGIRVSGNDPEWAPPAELRERIAHAHTHGRTDLRTAELIGDVLAQHRRSEDEVGGRLLWPVVRAQLDQVTSLIPNTSGQAADRLMLLAAEHAHWLSWVAWQEERRGAALAWIDLAHGWAVDGGHTDMASWAQRVRAHYSLERGDPVRALRTAEAARYAGPRPLSPAAEAVAVHQAAMAAAACAERDRARRLAEEAHELALQAPAEEARPGWLYWLDPVRARLQAADTAYACHRWGEAAEGFREALPALAGYPRDHAYYRARLEAAERRG